HVAPKKAIGALVAPRLSNLAEWTGLEPATPGVTGRYSNQLNYHSSATWWVLTGSNRRHSPCKGDALPAELSTPSQPREGQSVYCIFQCLASAELGHAGRLDLDGVPGAGIAAGARGALADVEGSEPHQRHHAAALHRGLDRGDGRLQRAPRRGLRDVGGLGDVIDDFELVHSSPPDVRQEAAKKPFLRRPKAAARRADRFSLFASEAVRRAARRTRSRRLHCVSL